MLVALKRSVLFRPLDGPEDEKPLTFSVRLRSFSPTQRLDDRFADARRFICGRVGSGLYGSMATVLYPVGACIRVCAVA